MAVSAGQARASPFDPIKGSWSGAVKFDTRHDPNAHSVGTLSMHVGTDGAVDAIDSANGCKISGIVHGPTGNLFYLDVRMKACLYPDFNRRWSGTVVLNPKDRSLGLSLQAQEQGAKGTKFFDAVGTLQK
jgi:hypothetical protein